MRLKVKATPRLKGTIGVKLWIDGNGVGSLNFAVGYWPTVEKILKIGCKLAGVPLALDVHDVIAAVPEKVSKTPVHRRNTPKKHVDPVWEETQAFKNRDVEAENRRILQSVLGRA